jgi:hypothetical protein
MDSQNHDGTERPVKRFTSYEDFQKEFYPKSSERKKSPERPDDDGEFGVDLAIDSLSRHADVLRFEDEKR